MRIAFVHNRYVAYRRALFQALRSRYDVTFFFEDEGIDQKPDFKCRFSRTIRIPSKNIRFSHLLPLRLMAGDFNLFISGDLAYTNTLTTFVLSKFLRKPFIIWSEEWHPDSVLKKAPFTMKKWIVKNSAACIGAGIKSTSFLKYLGAREDGLFTAPNASIPIVDLPDKDRSSDLDSFPEGDLLKILYLGRLAPSKGIEYLIEAFGTLQARGFKAALIIAGEGPILTKLEWVAREKRLQHILFTKRFAHDADKLRLYRTCDVLVLPSLYYGYVEGWGLVLNEVMYFGKPVIATDMVGAAYDLIDDGINGFIVPERNAEALCSALMRIMSDKALRGSMGLTSRKIITERYSCSKMIAGFEEAIDYVSREKPHQ
ncbi:MAG: glycosyltransferase family 4 protein [Deltaproteobacteria bacterium]|nr:glycosyltransferase family 4 protein [Deltaproteobacteria bacterium]